MEPVTILKAAWREPTEVLGAFADEPWTIGFLSGGDGARWSYVATAPDATLVISEQDRRDPFQMLAALAGRRRRRNFAGPPFQGGVAGLAAYELGDRIERLGLARLADWPDLACARYPAVLAFDHRECEVLAIGWGLEQARRALGWLDAPPSPSTAASARLTADDPTAYEAAVADVVARIAAGELFQANIARRWRGRLAAGGRPFDVLSALARQSPAPFASYLRLKGKAVVSNSPERFVRVWAAEDGLRAETRPIKGTARRGRNALEDARQAAALQASAKDRAENLMIVDLMRNDLARVCEAGTVEVPELFKVESFANVHHLVSGVTGRLTPGASPVDLLRAAFPPGSITGAPKVQAMKVIAELEAPRGPFFGSMFQLSGDGGMDSNVLIRTAAFIEEKAGWLVEARAGAGVVADSSPLAERFETEAKIGALAAAFEPPACAEDATRA